MSPADRFDSPSTLGQFPVISHARRRWKNRLFYVVCLIVSSLSILILSVLIYEIVRRGYGGFNTKFITNKYDPDDIPNSGYFSALIGTIWVCATCALTTIPLGVATAIFLEEYQPKNKIVRFFHSVVQLNISNLAGVPSVVYGIIGITTFVYFFGLFDNIDPKTGERQSHIEFGARYFDQFRTVYRDDKGRAFIVRVPVDSKAAPPTEVTSGMTAFLPNGKEVEIIGLEWDDPKPTDIEDQKRAVEFTETAGRYDEKRWYYFRLPFGRTVISASLTLMLVILPVVIISSQEAIRAVPSSLREGALGLGSTRWQVVRNVVLPASIPGIMTGSILAMSRAIGETAPILLVLGGTAFVSSAPSSLFDSTTVMPLQIYYFAGDSKAEMQELAANGIVLLLGALLTFNAIAILIRQFTQKPLS